jgi:Tol biopolymer transport system component
MGHRLLVRPFFASLVLLASTACSDDADPPPTRTTPEEVASTPVPATEPVLVGEPIDLSALRGRILLSGDEDVFVANVDGTGLVQLTTRPGPEFDAAWSPDGKQVVYRDSRRGINDDDEIFVMNADGTGARNISRNPANDWGPAWSPDGSTIVFNSDRQGGPLAGYLVDPDGSNVRRIRTDAFVEYPAWSPDGRRIAFMGQDRLTLDYDLYVVNVDGTGLVRLTETLGSDGWPAWSPDGTRIAFSSERDDCRFSDADDCRTTGDVGPHHDIWIVNPDGTGLHRVTPEFGQFVTWSPDGRYLMVAGYELYVIRPDGTGRATVNVEGFPGGGLFPDWTA